jgi:hypothetical protein
LLLALATHQLDGRLIAIEHDLTLRVEKPDGVSAALEQQAKHGIIIPQAVEQSITPLVAVTAGYVSVAHSDSLELVPTKTEFTLSPPRQQGMRNSARRTHL